MRKQPPILIELQQAYVVLKIGARVGGPRGIYSPLRDGGGLPSCDPDVFDERYKQARGLADIVARIQPAEAQAVVALAVRVKDGVPEYDRCSIAKALGVSEPTVTRRLRDGLRHVQLAISNFRLTVDANTGSIQAR